MTLLGPDAPTDVDPDPRRDTDTVTASRPRRPRSRHAEGREFIALVTALMSLTAVAIDLMLPTFPDMRREYGMAADSARISWVVTAFFLGMAAGPLLYGPASDRFGRRRPLIVGLGLYCVAAVISALAPSFGWLIAARFLWGLGAAGSRTLSLAIIRDRYEGPAMARLMSMIMAVFLLVPILAPGLGAGLNAIAPWRIVFWVPAVAAVGLLLWTRRLPETLAPADRRPFTWSALADATRVVLSNRESVYFTAAVTLLMGVMTGYLASSELILDGVYDLARFFPLFFGCNAVLLALSSLNNARLVSRLGINPLVRRTAAGGSVVVVTLCAVALVTDGAPNFWVFAVLMSLLLPLVQGLIPSCNTAAMLPVPHVAGTATAIIGTVSTAGGALIGGLLTSRFDGTIRPYAVGSTVLVLLAGSLVWLATTTRHRGARLPT